MTRKLRLGFDIGGTFTDFVIADEQSGEMFLEKCLTTPDDPSRGVRNGFNLLFERLEIDGSDLDVAIHATTLITNALIERRGVKTALVTTQGFRDILEMGSEVRYDLYDLFMEKPAPLIPRDLRFEVGERLKSDGSVITPLSESEIVSLCAHLKEIDVKSVAIAFIHAFRNPAHERRAAEIMKREMPDVVICMSSSVAPEIREFERTSTTSANAYAMPITKEYLDVVTDTLKTAKYGKDLYMMLSSGGVSDAGVAKEFPIRMLESGPAAGVLAAIFYAKQLGIPSLVTFDMGGTTAKVGVVKNYEAAKSNIFEFGRVARFKKGSGIPVKIPMIELIEIGAGGGSIAGVDQLGLLKVGPHSASAQPGPACYGLGGDLPTVTDSNLVLGNLNPGYFLGGSMKLDLNAARDALKTSVADPLGLSVEAAAAGVFDVVNQSMLSAMKVHITERGEDPRKFYLFAFGGAGPAHAYELARALHMKGVIIPNGAGAASAMGLVTSGVSFDFARSLVTQLNRTPWSEIEHLYEEMAEEGLKILDGIGIERGSPEISIAYQMDLRHKGQGHEVTVTIPAELIREGAPDRISELFYDVHEKKFGHAHRHLPVQLITCRMTVGAGMPNLQLMKVPSSGTDFSQAQKGSRDVYFTELRKYVNTPVYDRYLLAPEMAFPGPAIIEERECTVVVGPSGNVRIDEYGSIFIDL
ncbi:hydantoinase/oxoprolinase family protein [Microvirga flavescens]|uniref:hydantoinase/oxoprolinase family protein n=1 Tax=Microvirga flavescens TaxID=2249811 RepID=UPI0018E0A841|nr:hydantoinase/oxoprolinase family protein [Microvirga flavescens]